MGDGIKYKKLVYVCQPLEDNEENIQKAKRYCKRLTEIGFNPFSPVLYYSSFLDLSNKKDRYIAFKGALDMIPKCDMVFVFGNYVSSAMYAELESADYFNIPVKYNIIAN